MPKRGQFKSGAKKRSVYQRKYNSKPEQKKRRAIRNKARRDAMRKGKVRKGDGKDVDHVNRRSLSGKTRVMSASSNRKRNGHLSRRARRRRR